MNYDSEPKAADSKANAFENIQDKLKKEVRKEIKQPNPDQFLVKHPSNLTFQQVDIIKHTAQFVAKNGQKFLIGLSDREKKNPTFDFLKPTNAMFTFFTALVDAYSKCFAFRRVMEDILRIQQSIQDSMFILNRVGERFEYDRHNRQAKRKKDEIDEEERLIMAQIDWNEFVIVETIDIKDDEEIPLVQQNQIHQVNQMEEESKEEYERLNKKLFGVEKNGQNQKNLEERAPVQNSFISSLQEDVLVKKDYVRTAQNQNVAMIKCNNCHNYIPASELNEHLRIELMDPKFQQMKDDLRTRELNSIRSTGEEMTRNLETFKSKRPDIFGNVEDLITNEIEEEGISNKHFLSKEAIHKSHLTQNIEKPNKLKDPISKGETQIANSNLISKSDTQGSKKNNDSYFQGSTLSNVPMPNHEGSINPFQSHPASHDNDKGPHLMPVMQYKLICPVVNIRIPEHSDDDNWNFEGQTIQMQVDPDTSIGKIKESCSKLLAEMPISKIKLNTMNMYNLKDELSVAYYNLVNGHVLELSVKERGGRNKR